MDFLYFQNVYWEIWGVDLIPAPARPSSVVLCRPSLRFREAMLAVQARPELSSVAVTGFLCDAGPFRALAELREQQCGSFKKRGGWYEQIGSVEFCNSQLHAQKAFPDPRSSPGASCTTIRGARGIPAQNFGGCSVNFSDFPRNIAKS